MSLAIFFTSYMLNIFRALIYPSPGACDYSVELPLWSYYSWFDVCWSFGVVGLEWYPCCRLQPETRIALQLGAENHMLQLNIQCSWWWAYAPEICRAKNTSIKLPSCITLTFQVISWGRCTVKQPSKFRSISFNQQFPLCQRWMLESANFSNDFIRFNVLAVWYSSVTIYYSFYS